MSLPISFIACSFGAKRNYLTIAAQVDEFDANTRFTMLVFYDEADGGFSVAPKENIRVSTLLMNDDGLWLVGDRGEVWHSVNGQQVGTYQLPDSGISGRVLGTPNHIREIAGRLYVCGYAGQVYVFNPSRDAWEHMDTGVVEPEATARSLDLEGIDGTASDDIYTVGSGGAIFQWNGHAWNRINALTNAFLSRVRCLARDHIFVVGDKGVFIESDGRNWNVEQIAEADSLSLWDVEVYKNDIYVTAVSKILRRHNGVWSEVKHGFPMDDKTDFMRLAVGDGRLWVMGSKRLFSFDGKKWQRHISPDNG